MGVTLERVQFKFASIIGELCSEPDILSQFAVWVDLRLAEYKIKGAITLECDGESPDPAWLGGILSALLKPKLKEKTKDSVPSCCAHKCQCSKFNDQVNQSNTLAATDDGHTGSHEGYKRVKTRVGQHLHKRHHRKLNFQQSKNDKTDEPQSVCQMFSTTNGKESPLVAIKTEPEPDNCIIMLETNRPTATEERLPSTGVTRQDDHSCNTTESGENGSFSPPDEKDTPINQSLMSIIGNTLPDTDYDHSEPADKSDKLKTKLLASTPSQAVQMKQIPPEVNTFLLMDTSTPILVQVPKSAVNMMNDQCSFVNTVSSNPGQTTMSLPVSQFSHFQSSVQPITTPVPIQPAAVPIAPNIPVGSAVYTSVSRCQTKSVQSPYPVFSVAEKAKVLTSAKKRKSVDGNLRSHTISVGEASQSESKHKKQILPADGISESSKTISEPGVRQLPKKVVSILKTKPNLQPKQPNSVPNQVHVPYQGPNIPLKQGNKVCLKYPMKKVQLVTRYRPILPACQDSSSGSLNPEEVDTSLSK